MSNNTKRFGVFVLLLFAVSLIYACAPAKTTKSSAVHTYITHENPEKNNEIRHIKAVIKKVNERNSTIEDSDEWIGKAYSSLMFKNLRDIPREDYKKYRRYLRKNGWRLYVIVHPSYYTFFEVDRTLSSSDDAKKYPKKNLIERLFDQMTFYDYNFRVMQEMERMERDFLETASTEKKLILLVLPRDYKDHFTYGYVPGLDEFARYLNEITNESPSVLYMESSGYNDGSMREEDLDVLMDFAKEARVRTLVLGGGYIGRCLEGFYRSLLGKFNTNRVYVVPEISAASPEDINGKWGEHLLTDEGKLNTKVAAHNLRSPGAYNEQEVVPKLKRFYVYELN